jgi:hypothetical protein
VRTGKGLRKRFVGTTGRGRVGRVASLVPAVLGWVRVASEPGWTVWLPGPSRGRSEPLDIDLSFDCRHRGGLRIRDGGDRMLKEGLGAPGRGSASKKGSGAPRAGIDLGQPWGGRRDLLPGPDGSIGKGSAAPSAPVLPQTRPEPAASGVLVPGSHCRRAMWCSREVESVHAPRKESSENIVSGHCRVWLLHVLLSVLYA